MNQHCDCDDPIGLFFPFLSPQNMCFIAQQKTTLNSSLLLRSYLSDHCWSRHLIASDVSRFLFDFCICRAWLIMWTMSTFEAEKLPGLCGGAPWVCQVPCWDLSGEAEFSMSHNNEYIIQPAAKNNDNIIKVSPAVRDRWGFTPLVEAHRYKLVWLAFIY